MTAMTKARIAFAVPGLALGGYGAVRLLLDVPGDLTALALWLAGVVVAHDFVLSPALAGVGVALTRLPERARRFVQGGLVVSALVTVVAVALIARRGTQPADKALLLADYGLHLAVLVGLVAAASVLLYVRRVVADRRTTNRRPPASQDSSGSSPADPA